MRHYTVVLSPDPERGGFSVNCPAAPGALSAGDTRDEALANIKESVELWLEVTLEGGGDALSETAELVAGEVERILEFREEFGWDRRIETATIAVVVPVAA
jgi:predicted RNase H-like HicB family nuclease